MSNASANGAQGAGAGANSGTNPTASSGAGPETGPATSPQITTLGNGLRVVSHNMAHLETVSLGVWVGCGARHERNCDNGMSHLLEHMAFKGTATRSARQIVEQIEQVGGDLNAATSLENTAYYARVLKGDVELALELLADILINPSYAEAELERERDVILQEIAATKDSPEEIAYDLSQWVAFPDQPVGRPILGTKDKVASFDSADLRRFLGQNYGANRMIVSAAGAVHHDGLVRHAEALFGGLTGVQAGELEGARYVGGTRHCDKPFEQSHLVLAFEGPSYLSQEFYTAQVFSGLFGGGMSSRLFQEVRERRGLCYSIYSSCWGLADCGVFNIHAATGPEAMGELIEVVSSELGRAAADTPTEREVARAKAQLKAGLLMSLESSSARAEQMARQLMAFGRLHTTEHLIDSVENVTAGALREWAEALLTRSAPSFTVVGNGAGSSTAGMSGLPFAGAVN